MISTVSPVWHSGHTQPALQASFSQPVSSPPTKAAQNPAVFTSTKRTLSATVGVYALFLLTSVVFWATRAMRNDRGREAKYVFDRDPNSANAALREDERRAHYETAHRQYKMYMRLHHVPSMHRVV